MNPDKESPEYIFYDNTEDLLIRSFCYHSNDTKRNSWLGCVHIAQLMTDQLFQHSFILQLCYKPIGILHN